MEKNKEIFGWNGIRTNDLWIKGPALYQLTYPALTIGDILCYTVNIGRIADQKLDTELATTFYATFYENMSVLYPHLCNWQHST